MDIPSWEEIVDSQPEQVVRSCLVDVQLKRDLFPNNKHLMSLMLNKYAIVWKIKRLIRP